MLRAPVFRRPASHPRAWQVSPSGSNPVMLNSGWAPSTWAPRICLPRSRAGSGHQVPLTRSQDRGPPRPPSVQPFPGLHAELAPDLRAVVGRGSPHVSLCARHARPLPFFTHPSGREHRCTSLWGEGPFFWSPEPQAASEHLQLGLPKRWKGHHFLHRLLGQARGL